MTGNAIFGPAIDSFTGLLQATQCADADELNEHVDDQVEMSAHVEQRPDGVALVVDFRFVAELSYPFRLTDFWSSLESLDAECWRHYGQLDVGKGR